MVRIEIVNRIFDQIDELFVKLMNEQDLDFEEIDLILYRLNEKVFRAKIDSYLMYKLQEPNVKFEPRPDKKDDMYQ